MELSPLPVGMMLSPDSSTPSWRHRELLGGGKPPALRSVVSVVLV